MVGAGCGFLLLWPIVAYVLYGWDNVVDELYCSAVVAASWIVGLGIKGYRREPCMNHFGIGVLTSLLAWMLCALCAPWSTIELLVVGLFCAINVYSSVTKEGAMFSGIVPRSID